MNLLQRLFRPKKHVKKEKKITISLVKETSITGQVHIFLMEGHICRKAWTVGSDPYAEELANQEYENAVMRINLGEPKKETIKSTVCTIY